MSKKSGWGNVSANEESAGHPSQDKSARFELDALFRKRGFRIWKRPRKGVSLWVREGIAYSQDEVVDWLRDAGHGDKLDDALYLEELANQGWK